MDQFAVIFDMDGLMLDTERMARVAWTRALAEQGFELSSENYLRLVGHTVQDAQLILEEMFGPAIPFQEIFQQRTQYYQDDINSNGIPVKPGLFHLLDFLEANQITKAVASSTPCWFARQKLAHAEIEKRFKCIVCGDMVTHGKPEPDLFLEAARLIGFAPSQCVVLEDSEAGILAAHRAGMLPLMIPDLKQPTPEIRNLTYRVMTSLDEAIPLIEDFLKTGLPQF